MPQISNSKESLDLVKHLLSERSIIIEDINSVIVDYFNSRPVYHNRIKTTGGLYHIKFQKTEQIPRPTSVMSGAIDSDERLKYVIEKFGAGNPSNIGINLSVIQDLIEIEENQHETTYFINVLGNGIVFWRRCREMYEFAMAHGTIIYDSKTYKTSILQIPTGWLIPWNEPIKAFPALV